MRKKFDLQKKIFVAATGAVLTLALAACSGSSSSLDDVKYSLNDATAEPSVSFQTPFTTDETSTHVIEEGDGEEIKDGDNLLIEATVFNGDDGSKVGSTYAQSPILIPVGEDLKKTAPELYDVLTSSKVGTSFSYTSNMVPGADASGSPSASEAAEDTPANVEVYTVKSKLLENATGDETPQKDLNSALESFKVGDDGKAELKLKADRGDAPKELVSQDMIKGKGEKVKASDTLYVKYQGVRWEDGKAFDGNFDGTPAELNLQGVIKGWTQGLEGKTIGSRVLLIIPEDLAYGKDAGENAPSGPLVFVVDILGASDNPQAAASMQSPSASASGSASASPSASPTAESAEPTTSAQPTSTESGK